MTRLVAFGCSHTYGETCSDRIQNCWPAQLAQKWQINFVNNGVNGASAKEISNYILNYELNSNDIVIILWSHWTRSFRFDQPRFWSKTKIKNSRNSQKTSRGLVGSRDFGLRNTYNLVWLRHLYNHFDNAFEAVSYQNLCYYELNGRNIKNYHFLVDEYQYGFITEHFSWNVIPYDNSIFLTNYFDMFPLAGDKEHTDKEGYNHFTNLISTKLNNEVKV
tara:strand:- start:621 stop:1277 length:657 start_codon:yes stop_codon:yes gene_type:complete